MIDSRSRSRHRRWAAKREMKHDSQYGFFFQFVSSSQKWCTKSPVPHTPYTLVGTSYWLLTDWAVLTVDSQEDLWLMARQQTADNNEDDWSQSSFHEGPWYARNELGGWSSGLVRLVVPKRWLAGGSEKCSSQSNHKKGFNQQECRFRRAGNQQWDALSLCSICVQQGLEDRRYYSVQFQNFRQFQNGDACFWTCAIHPMIVHQGLFLARTSLS